MVMLNLDYKNIVLNMRLEITELFAAKTDNLSAFETQIISNNGGHELLVYLEAWDTNSWLHY